MSETNEPIDEVVSQEMRRAGFGSEQDGYKVITVDLLEAILARQLEQVREIVREEISAALDERAGNGFVEPNWPEVEGPAANPARIEYTPEIEQWYAAHPFVDDKGQTVDTDDWAQQQWEAMTNRYNCFLSDSELNWQSRAFVALYDGPGGVFGDDMTSPECWLAFHYYMSLASTHPDWNVEGSPAWLVRQARERAIEEQREKQGGNPV